MCYANAPIHHARIVLVRSTMKKEMLKIIDKIDESLERLKRHIDELDDIL